METKTPTRGIRCGEAAAGVTGGMPDAVNALPALSQLLVRVGRAAGKSRIEGCQDSSLLLRSTRGEEIATAP